MIFRLSVRALKRGSSIVGMFALDFLFSYQIHIFQIRFKTFFLQEGSEKENIKGRETALISRSKVLCHMEL